MDCSFPFKTIKTHQEVQQMEAAPAGAAVGVVQQQEVTQIDDGYSDQDEDGHCQKEGEMVWFLWCTQEEGNDTNKQDLEVVVEH